MFGSFFIEYLYGKSERYNNTFTTDKAIASNQSYVNSPKDDSELCHNMRCGVVAFVHNNDRYRQRAPMDILSEFD